MGKYFTIFPIPLLYKKIFGEFIRKISSTLPVSYPTIYSFNIPPETWKEIQPAIYMATNIPQKQKLLTFIPLSDYSYRILHRDTMQRAMLFYQSTAVYAYNFMLGKAILQHLFGMHIILRLVICGI